jgi:gliding motility-associated-like protein
MRKAIIFSLFSGLFGFASSQSLPVLSLQSKTDISCNGLANGQVIVSVSGGSGPLVFSQNGISQSTGTFSGLKAGNFKFFVTDSLGDKDSLIVNLSEPTQLTAQFTVTQPSCEYKSDGSIQSSISGGTGNKNLGWTDSAGFTSSSLNLNYLSEGVYFVRVTDANSCLLDTSVELVHQVKIALTITTNDITCSGLINGTAVVNITGTGSGYSQIWTGPNAYSSTLKSINGLAAGSYSVKVTETVSGCSALMTSTIVNPTKLKVEITSIRAALCNSSSDGQMNIKATGGRAPYLYSWSGPNSYFSSKSNISDAAAGTYIISITDSSGCSAADTGVVNEPAALSIIPTITDVRCFGQSNGQINLNVNGGVKPYAYSWSNSLSTKDITSLSSGVYGLTLVDSNGCKLTRNYSVSSPTRLELSYNSNTVKCNGGSDGSITLLATGGSFPWSYKVTGPSSYNSTSVTNKNLIAGTYSLMLTDNNGCKDSEVVNITQPNKLVAVHTTTQPLCYGLKGGMSLNVSGGTSPYSYEWLDGNSALYAATQNVISADVGKYTYTVIDANQCTFSDTLSIYQPTELKLRLKSTTLPVCLSDLTGSASLGCLGGVRPYNFQINSSSFVTDSLFKNLGVGSWVVTVKDKNSCVDTVSFGLKNNDIQKPTVVLKNITRYLNNSGKVTVSVSEVDQGITDNCELKSVSLSKTDFDCSNIGVNTVQVTAVDGSGNTQSNSCNITVLDTVKPILKAQSVNVYLNASGKGNVSPAQANNSSIDNCSISQFNLAKTQFDCSNLGSNAVLFSATDGSGNTSSVQVQVQVQDTLRPVLKYKNIIVFLNSSGSVSITPADVDDGSTDNCQISKYEISQSTFNCNNLGTNFIDFKIYDPAQNVSSQSVRVTVQDTFKPVSKTKPVTLYLNQYGFAVLAPADVDDGSTDNCKIATRSISQSVYTCGNLGSNLVGYTLTDPSGNTTSTQVSVTVKDTSKPINKVRNGIAYLDKNGFAVTTYFDIDNGTSDNCGVDKISLSKDRFTCQDLGQNTIDFTSYDKSGNSSVSAVNINVLDTVKPVLRASNRTIVLDSTGRFTVTPMYFDDGSFDNCKITKRTLTQSSFDCSDVGNKLIIYTISDTSGNSSLAILNVSILDTLSPRIFVENKVVFLDSQGKTGLSVNAFASKCYDNCSISKLYLSDSTYDCSERGTRVVQLIAVDPSGNRAVKSFLVNVLDTLSPEVFTKTATIYIDTAGRAALSVPQVLDSLYENCGSAQVYLTQYVFGIKDIGENFVFAYAFDQAGNRSKNIYAKVNVEIGDADRDSIPDYIEGSQDFDGDGVLNYRDHDSDNDGVLDRFENSGLKVLLDLDQDGFYNVYDVDTDGDQIYDVAEVNGFDPDQNGTVGIGRVTVNSRGIPVLSNGGDGYGLMDTDGDGIADYKDSDSDQDGITDKTENFGKREFVDSDGDGKPNFRDEDSDADGISDLIETTDDFDRDGTPNYLDRDSDNDQILDLVETNNDQDGDGFGNYLDLDSDSDGIYDDVEGEQDIDKDGKGNWIDDDSDNDGITDDLEGNDDTDSDGIPDFKDADSDNDGILDLIEAIPFDLKGLPADTDSDGEFDFRDFDCDNDGIPDYDEGYPNLPDTDKDGIPDYRDDDSDNDGVLDFLESNKDTDNDGLIDAIDPDSDNDGIQDVIEGYADLDGDGIVNSLDLDSDNDGINDIMEAGGIDLDGNGMLDSLEVLVPVDADGDGILNQNDIDSDGDGIYDIVESGMFYTDLNGDGRVDGIDTDRDGIQDEADGISGVFGDLYDKDAIDTDGDGIRDFEDLDSDDDGIDDEIETSSDFDLDMIANYLDDDSDDDKISDLIETANDQDGDGIPNFLDLDSDGDAISDLIETNADYDLDGIANYLDLDSDNDEMPDSEEGEGDNDKNSFADFVDPHTFVPEIFTPNNDGVNDLLFIRGLKNFPNASLVVFNQWGVIVYDSKGAYMNDWDGTFRGESSSTILEKLPEGVYFYILNHNRTDSPQFSKPQTKGNFYIKP